MWPTHYRAEGERGRHGYINVMTGVPMLRQASWSWAWMSGGYEWHVVLLVTFDIWRESYRVFPRRNDLDWLFVPRLVRGIVGVYRYGPPEDYTGVPVNFAKWCLIDYLETACD